MSSEKAAESLGGDGQHGAGEETCRPVIGARFVERRRQNLAAERMGGGSACIGKRQGGQPQGGITVGRAGGPKGTWALVQPVARRCDGEGGVPGRARGEEGGGSPSGTLNSNALIPARPGGRRGRRRCGVRTSGLRSSLAAWRSAPDAAPWRVVRRCRSHSGSASRGAPTRVPPLHAAPILGSPPVPIQSPPHRGPASLSSTFIF